MITNGVFGEERCPCTVRFRFCWEAERLGLPGRERYVGSAPIGTYRMDPDPAGTTRYVTQAWLLLSYLSICRRRSI